MVPSREKSVRMAPVEREESSNGSHHGEVCIAVSMREEERMGDD